MDLRQLFLSNALPFQTGQGMMLDILRLDDGSSQMDISIEVGYGRSELPSGFSWLYKTARDRGHMDVTLVGMTGDNGGMGVLSTTLYWRIRYHFNGQQREDAHLRAL